MGQPLTAKQRREEGVPVFGCPVFKSRISQGVCEEYASSGYNNTTRCTREFQCTCPWRKCYACVVQGLGKSAGVVVNPGEGLCLFHKKFGVDAHREKSTESETDVSGAFSLRRSIPPDEVRESAARLAVVAIFPKKTENGRVPMDTVLEVDCSKVVPLEHQPRTYFDKEAFRGLVDSIDKAGQLQVVPAVSLPDGTFRIRDGERRWRACKKLGRKLRIVIVPELSHEEEIEQAAVANFNRQGHTPLEKAHIFMFLRVEPLNRSVEQIATQFGVTTVTIYNHLLLLEKLDPEVQALMDPNVQGGLKNILNVSIAQYLTAFHEHPQRQVTLAKKILKSHLNIREAKVLIAAEAGVLKIMKGRGRQTKPDDNVRMLKRMLSHMENMLDHFDPFTEEEWSRVWAARAYSEKEELIKRSSVLRQRLDSFEENIRTNLSSRSIKK